MYKSDETTQARENGILEALATLEDHIEFLGKQIIEIEDEYGHAMIHKVEKPAEEGLVMDGPPCCKIAIRIRSASGCIRKMSEMAEDIIGRCGV